MTPCDWLHVNESLMTVQNMRMLTSHKDSLIIYIVSPLEFHPYISSEVNRWPQYFTANIHLHLLEPEYPELLGELHGMKHSQKPCVMLRLFLDYILSNVSKVIYLDTDVIFFSPPVQLWKKFELFSDQQFLGFGPQNGVTGGSFFNIIKKNGTYFQPLKYYPPNGINPGIGLYHLDRIRQGTFRNDVENIFLHHRDQYIHDDQGLLNYYLYYHPETMYNLGCEWNFKMVSCSSNKFHCEIALNDGISLLHGTCESFHSPTLNAPFRMIYDIFSNFEFLHFSKISCVKLIETIHQSLKSGTYNGALYKDVLGHGCSNIPRIYTKQIQSWINSNYFKDD